MKRHVDTRRDADKRRDASRFHCRHAIERAATIIAFRWMPMPPRECRRADVAAAEFSRAAATAMP